VDEELPDIYLRTPPRPLVVYGQAGAKGEYIIPLQRYGEINGMVMREGRDGQKRPVARLQLVVRNADGKAVARTRTEEDGFFILDNLPLGQYQVDIETTENAMKGLTMRSDARFTIEAKKYLIEDIEIFVNNED